MIPAKSRVAIHMAQATGLGLDLRGKTSRSQFHTQIWKLWMTLAALILLSSGLAILVVAILRKGL